VQSLSDKGSLYIVATPIGNLEDMTFRAVEVLKNSELILCENPNNSKKMLFRYQIESRTAPLYASTRDTGFNWIFEILEKGKNISYISDAGTPGISDPGSRLVREARERGFQSIPIPGASALSAILSVCGSQTNPTVFLGFLAEKKGKKQKDLEEFAGKECLVVYYESVYKIKETLRMTREIYPHSEILIGRELTKAFEEILVWNPEAKEPPVFKEKGEFVVLINNHIKKMAKANSITTDIFD
jgi:16S rRNA (cytidine1402-2'-O)-methyltransferase